MPVNARSTRDLQHELHLTLQTLSDFTKATLDAFHGNDGNAFARLDKELETTVGRKERIVGALRQHVKDHKCSGTEAASIQSKRAAPAASIKWRFAKTKRA